MFVFSIGCISLLTGDMKWNDRKKRNYNHVFVTLFTHWMKLNIEQKKIYLILTQPWDLHLCEFRFCSADDWFFFLGEHVIVRRFLPNLPENILKLFLYYLIFVYIVCLANKWD